MKCKAPYSIIARGVVGNIALKIYRKAARMKIKICDLRAPAKCTRTQIHCNVPFAESELCDECEHQREMEIKPIKET